MTAAANYLEPIIKRVQPSAKTYYGRSDAQPRGIHLVAQSAVYPWYRLWVRYQKDLLEFSKKRKFVVVTDLQNFFDSINTNVLRRALSVITVADEVPDFIIYLFENFSVRERYAPYRVMGIPTIESDLPRLMAHCLLFDLDRYLTDVTGNCYTRWVDDINFGVSDRTQAREFIRQAERLLFRSGLRLGGGKTQVLDREALSDYIQEEENQHLNVVLGTDDNEPLPLEVDGDRLVDRFLSYRVRGHYGHREKVIRRYYNSFAARERKLLRISSGKLKELYRASKEDFREYPDTRFRQTVARFWLSLPVTSGLVMHLIRTAGAESSHDDVLTATILCGLVGVRIPPKLIKKLLAKKDAVTVARAGGFYGIAWLLAKYGTQRDIVEFVQKTFPFWSSHDLYARQIVALWSLLPRGAAADRVFRFLRDGRQQSVQPLIEFVEQLRAVNSLTPSLRSFLPPGLSASRFDFYRAVVSCALLRSDNLGAVDKTRLTDGIRKMVKDPITRAIASGVYQRP